MKHFNEEEWQKLKNGECSAAESCLMEEHLLKCPKCMDLFLNSFDEKDAARAQKAIPPDFTDTVIGMISGERPEAVHFKPAKGANRQAKRAQNLALYYTAAAVLTIALMSGGAFQTFVKGYSNAAGTTEQNSHKIEQKLDIQFSKKIVDRTHQLLIRFENEEQKEVR
jgi:predicted anti-sigma-YlaC factor YlaD